MPDIHQLRVPPAWCFDCESLDQAASADAKFICLVEGGSRRRWWAPLAAFFDHGFRVERGHGEQVGLALEYWRVEDPGEAWQLALFAEVAP